MNKSALQLLVSFTSVCGLLFSMTSSATDLATKPVSPSALTKPNVIFGLDDSGSMEAEVMVYSNDGAFWWDYNRSSGWGIDPSHPNPGLRKVPAPWFNQDGVGSTQWREYFYLFPNGIDASASRRKDSGARYYGDRKYDTFALLPTSQFAWMRSSAFNPIYYDPTVTYMPWARAQLSTGAYVAGAADPARVKSHPLLGSTTMNLGQFVEANTVDNFVFTAMPGMRVPGGSQKLVCDVDNGNCAASWVPVTQDEDAAPVGVTRVAMRYFPATYWVKESCSVPARPSAANDDCASAYDGSTLKRYEIKPGRSFPSGRSYADELQNFANWFQYYRKRKLMMAAAMGSVMEGLGGVRTGLVTMSAPQAPIMFDTDSTNNDINGRRLAGMIYENTGIGSTPTRQTLDFIGQQFHQNPSIVQNACQRNNAFILTDGFANRADIPLQPWDAGKSATTWGADAPFQTTLDGTLADIALRYYTNNLRPDFVTGALRTTPRDPNPDLHMATYALTLGARGILLTAENTPVPTTRGAWPVQTTDRSPSAIDDLWHATINGRGKMYIADTPTETAIRVRTGLDDMLSQVGAQSSLAVSSVNLRRGDSKAYLATYDPQGWAGDVSARALDKSNGEVTTDDPPVWSAAAKLAATDWRSRSIVSFDGARGVPFTFADLGAATPGSTAEMFDYMRGNRAGEGVTFRARTSLLGAIFHAAPVVAREDKVVYSTSGEGMLHALDADTGAELWAYVPGTVLPRIAAGTAATALFRTQLDGTPTLWQLDSTRLLVGGRGAAGPGFYALDVTHPRGLTQAQLAGKVKWEFPNASTPAGVRATIGSSVGRPVVVKTRSRGWVVLLTSGYNDNVRDGKGRVFMLDAQSGTLLQTFVADTGSTGAPTGLTQISAMSEPDGFVRYAYGGDERGNLWRFNLEETVDSKKTNRIAQLRAGASIQPITAAPELVFLGGERIILIGTGRMLGISDFDASGTQSFYAIKDGTELTNTRSSLVARSLVPASSGSGSDLSGGAVDWTTSRGWYFDLPAGQQANTDPSAAFGAIAFTTNMASMTTCSESSAMYLVNISTGLKVEGNNAVMVPLSNRMASRIVLMTTTGTLPANRTVGDITTSDGKVIHQPLVLPGAVTPRKNAWKQLHRD